MKKRILLILCTALGALTLAAVDASLTRAEGGPPSTGTQRYPIIVHRGATLPPPDQGKPVPLLIGLHARGATPQLFEQTSGLDAVADAHGFVVAYLSSLKPTSPAWTRADMPANLAYVSAAIAQLIDDQNIDSNRVYVTGFSAGATMAFNVGCQLSAQVAGIAPVSGAMRFSDPPCKLAHPVAELSIIGTRDAIPINGSDVLLSANAVAARWRELNSCTTRSGTSTNGPATAANWSNCNDWSSVGLTVIQGGGHQWPGAPQATGPDKQYNAAEAIWTFFAAHPGTPTTAPTASLSSLTMRRLGHKRWVQAAFSSRESTVALQLTLKRGSRPVSTKRFMLERGPRSQVTVQVPVAAPGGRYSLTVALVDAYGRRLTAARTVTIPK